jgi:hypothetical protein
MSDAVEALSGNETLSTVVKNSARKRRGIEPRYWTLAEEDRLEQLRAVEGLTPKAIAVQMGRSEQSVVGKIARMGLELPADWKRARGMVLTEVKLAALRRCWAGGVRVIDAARIAGTSQGSAERAYLQFAEQERGAVHSPRLGTYIGHKEMMAIVAPICGVPVSAITGPTRIKPNVCARMAIAKALRDRGLSLPQIARKLGRTDHSTIINYLRNFGSYSTVYPETLRAYQAIKRAEAMAAERLAA